MQAPTVNKNIFLVILLNGQGQIFNMFILHNFSFFNWNKNLQRFFSLTAIENHEHPKLKKKEF